MFESFSGEHEPSWKEKLLVVILFVTAASITAAVSPVLPLVDFRFWHIWLAGLSTLTAALPLARQLVIASRNSAHLKIAVLSLFLCALAYVALPVWLMILPSRTSFDGSTEASWQLAAFVAYGIFMVTWPVYVPAALLAGYVIAGLARRHAPKEPR